MQILLRQDDDALHNHDEEKGQETPRAQRPTTCLSSRRRSLLKDETRKTHSHDV